jgi:hypothetical protein
VPVRATCVSLLLVFGCAAAKPKAESRRMTQDQLEWLLSLGRVVVEGKETPEEAARRIGEVRETTNGTLYVTPADARYESAMVSFDIKSRKLRSITFSGQQFPSVAELEARLGKYAKGGRTQPRQPIGLSFSIDLDPKLPGVCTVIAYVTNDHEPADKWRVQSLVVMTDARL